jgi:hypothetical protein
MVSLDILCSSDRVTYEGKLQSQPNRRLAAILTLNQAELARLWRASSAYAAFSAG